MQCQHQTLANVGYILCWRLLVFHGCSLLLTTGVGLGIPVIDVTVGLQADEQHSGTWENSIQAEEYLNGLCSSEDTWIL